MEHATGIEPARLAWEAKVLPLNYACIFVKKPFSGLFKRFWWVLTGSNRRPSVRQTDALPAELNTHFCWMRFFKRSIIIHSLLIKSKEYLSSNLNR